MTQELKNQNQATEQKQNVVAVEENINHGLESESQSPTEINTEISIDDSAANKLKNQISFSTKALEQQQKEFGEILSSSAKQLNNAVKTFDRTIADQQKQYVILQNEVGILTVLPEQLKKEIKNIIPDMARHIDAVYQEKLQALNNAHNDTVAANKELTSVLDQKLDEYSKKLSDSASYVTQCSNTSFLKNMCLVVLFSAIVAGGTAYLVTTKFPRYLTVTGANNVTIQDCDVSVLGKAKDNDNLMEQMTRKKLPQKN